MFGGWWSFYLPVEHRIKILHQPPCRTPSQIKTVPADAGMIRGGDNRAGRRQPHRQPSQRAGGGQDQKCKGWR